jgi:type IV secretion system protein VirB9
MAAVLLAGLALGAPDSRAALTPARTATDGRIRMAAWRDGEVFELRGRVGFQIDLEFETGETFVGLASGDLDALSFVAQANHLFLKPRAANIRTNVTVLTNRRHYQFEYRVGNDGGVAAADEEMYALRFTYPAREDTASIGIAARIDAELRSAAAVRPINIDYWYCGSPAIKPLSASDDGLHTRLRFAARAELPVLFVRNDDGTESLLNFNIDGGELIVHRIAKTFVVRRGRLTGCIVNKAYRGSTERSSSGTVAPAVERITEGAQP